METKKTTKELFSTEDDLQKIIANSLKKTEAKEKTKNSKDDIIEIKNPSDEHEYKKESVKKSENLKNQKTEKIRLSSDLYNEIKEIVFISKISTPDKKITIKSYIENIVQNYLLDHKDEILSQKKTAIKKMNERNN